MSARIASQVRLDRFAYQSRPGGTSHTCALVQQRHHPGVELHEGLGSCHRQYGSIWGRSTRHSCSDASRSRPMRSNTSVSHGNDMPPTREEVLEMEAAAWEVTSTSCVKVTGWSGEPGRHLGVGRVTSRYRQRHRASRTRATKPRPTCPVRGDKGGDGPGAGRLPDRGSYRSRWSRRASSILTMSRPLSPTSCSPRSAPGPASTLASHFQQPRRQPWPAARAGLLASPPRSPAGASSSVVSLLVEGDNRDGAERARKSCARNSCANCDDEIASLQLTNRCAGGAVKVDLGGTSVD